MKKIYFTLAITAICSSSVFASDWNAEEVFGDPIVTIEGNVVNYSFDEDAIFDIFADVTGDVQVWNNSNANVTLYSAAGEVIEVSHIGAWDNNVTFTADLNLESGNYIVFDEGVVNVIANDEEEGETLAKLQSPAYTYSVTPTVINSVEQNNAQVVYNLAGQRMTRAEKGLYVVGGKKVIVK